MTKPNSPPAKSNGRTNEALKTVPPVAGTSILTRSLSQTNASLRDLQTMQEMNAKVQQQYLEGQLAAQKSFEQLLAGQQQLLAAALNGGDAAVRELPEPRIATKVAVVEEHAPQVAEVTPVVPATPENGAASAPNVDQTQTLLEVVAECTGYPKETLDLDMDMESDLGIDSIKRVEILSAYTRMVENAPSVEPEKLGRLRTLRQVCDAVSDEPIAAVPATASLEATLVEVVSECTGYPPEVIDLDTNMESELGIDSIKRVEILSAFKTKAPHVPAVEPEQLSQTATIRQVLALVTESRPKTIQTQSSAQNVGEPATAVKQIAEPVVERWVVTPRPLPPAVSVRSLDHAWVVDDGTDFARRLCSHLGGRLIARDAAPLEEPCTLLVLLDGGPPTEVLEASFLLVQRQAARLCAAGAQLVSITRSGGRFGFAEDGISAAGGLAGLVKTAQLEWPEITGRVLDVAPDIDLDLLSQELAAAEPIEVGLTKAERIGLSLEPRALHPRANHKEGLVVISGGARGVTAHCALALARTGRYQLLLLGRTEEAEPEPEWLVAAKTETEVKAALVKHAFQEERPSPRVVGAACRKVLAEREIAATIAAIRETGTEVTYRAIDVRDEKAVEQAVASARKQVPIVGVVHGAGVLRDKRIEDKSKEDFDLVFDTKVLGLSALLAAVREDQLDFLAAFTSVSGRFGRSGQVDYAMANEALGCMLRTEATRRRSCRVVSLDWGPWEGGMVTPALRRQFQREGVALIPTGAGAEHFLEEIEAEPTSETQVVVGVGLVDPDQKSSREIVVDPQTHLYLEDHQLAGKAVVPLAMMLEWFAAAAREASQSAFCAVRDLRLYEGVVLADEPVRLRVILEPRGQGTYAARLEDEDQKTRASATVEVGEVKQPPAARHLQLDQAASLDAAQAYAERRLFHGVRMQAIERVLGVNEEGIAADLIGASDASAWIRGQDRWVTDPLLIDGCFQTAILWGWVHRGTPSLPQRVERYEQYCERLPDRARVFVHPRAANDANLEFDLDLVDEKGLLVARIDGYRCTTSASLKQAYGYQNATEARL